MTAPIIRQWCSTSWSDGVESGGSEAAHQQCLANEIVRAPNDAKGLSKALIRASTDEKGLAFLVLSVQNLTPNLMHLALDGGRAHPRVVLAADRATLEHFGSQIADGRVGLMLDNVDMETPLSSIVWEHLEAIRFSPSYLARASRDLRTNCALECMLALAKDLGLCTFGPTSAVGAEIFPGGRKFDYLPLPSPPSSVALGTLRTKGASRSAFNAALTR